LPFELDCGAYSINDCPVMSFFLVALHCIASGALMHRVSFFLSSYICIVAFHLDTIDEPREGCDVGAEPEDGEWWTRLEDGRMDPDVHDRRKMLAEQLFSN